jgi:putative NADPH-quinone reductase
VVNATTTRTAGGPESSATTTASGDHQGASVVVVFAHPCPESYVARLFEASVAGLTTAGHHVETIDLHEFGYLPNGSFPAAHAAALDRASTLVLVYPTWWSAQPAILTGWLAAAAPTGLGGVRRIVTVTTHGGSRWANRLAGQSGLGVVERALRASARHRPSCRRLALYGNDRGTDAMRRSFLRRVERRIGRLVV